MGLMTALTNVMTRFTLTFLLLVPYSISISHATSFVPIPLTSQVGEADTIVRGKTGQGYSDYGPRNDGGRSIYTYYQLQVSEVLKGDVAPSSSISIREMGGEVNGVGMQVAGASHFDPGEDVVVFLGPKNPDGSYDVKGLSSGKYNIRTDDDGTENLLGLVQNETMASLRKVVREQSHQHPKPTHSATPSPSASVAVTATHPAALQLQPSNSSSSKEEGKPSAKLSIWVSVLAVGLLGWFALRRYFKR